MNLITNRMFLRLVLLVLVSIAAFAALNLNFSIRPSTYSFQLGDVATQDIQAPSSLSYTSEVLTEQARLDAENAVAPIYLPADPSISRRQIEKMRMAFQFITIVQADQYATREQKISDLMAIEAATIDRSTAESILALDQDAWKDVQDESLHVLELVMRNTIREDEINESIRSVPTLINFSLPVEQSSVVSALVTRFITANSLLSEEQTQAARLQARENTAEVTRRFIAGETIVRRGQIITPLIWESLNQYGLIKSGRDYNDLAATGILVLVITIFIALYFNRRRLSLLQDFRSLLMVSFNFILFLIGARLIIPNHTIVPYIFPLAAFGLTIGSLYSMEVGMVLSLLLSILATFGLSPNLELLLYFVLPTLCGILVLGKGPRVANFFVAGLAVGIFGSAIILAYRLTDNSTDWIGLLTLVLAAFLNGAASAGMTLLLQYIFSQVLGLTTALRL
ncbi:MAG: hypothetical protein GYA17_12920, partial [Chloroflexi bacterium]|nr:hypothetical protein [Chloroflexota bacterium]